MLNPDFSDRTYTAEVLKTNGKPTDALKAILKLTQGPKTEEEVKEGENLVRLVHCFLPSVREYHRFPRTVTLENGSRVEIPRSTIFRGKKCSLYDIIIAQCQNYLVIAVPFHHLAEEFFVRVDSALAGTRTLYEKINITSLVMGLGASGTTEVEVASTGEKVSLSLTRCHLSYADRDRAIGHLKQVQMTGPNLGASQEYQTLVKPVLKPVVSGPTVTPIVLGFALIDKGVKKSTATTDQHGNFKIWMAPGVKRMTRIFGLLEAIRVLEDVASTTANIPILRSRTIRDAED